jgi:toxin ParE1/3/4
VSGGVRLDPRAAKELAQAADWYEEQRSGLGRELVLEVRAVVRTLAHRTRAGSPVDRVDPTLDVRRIPLRRFPYHVVYVVKAEDVVVIAVAHWSTIPVEASTTRKGRSSKVDLAPR